MGSGLAKSRNVTRRVIWTDTEGGVRGVPMWDITFIDEGRDGSRHALRLFRLADVHKAGRARLRKYIPLSVYMKAMKTGSVYAAEYTLSKDGVWGDGEYRPIDMDMKAAVGAYLKERKGCVLCAWNMKAHDRHVLNRLVGNEIVSDMVLWDALPWFRSKFTLPKNGLSSDKPGTPRHTFGVLTQGIAHSSLADAAHLRELVLRAAYCLSLEGEVDTTASAGVTCGTMFDAACAQIQDQVREDEWVPVPRCAWGHNVPAAVYKA